MTSVDVVISHDGGLWERICVRNVERCSLIICNSAKNSEVTLLIYVDASSNASECDSARWSYVGEWVLVSENRRGCTMVSKYEVFAQRVVLIM